MHPIEVGYCDTPDWAYGVATSGDHVYVADGHAGLRVISVSDPTHPTEAGYCDTPEDAIGVAVGGNYAYVVDYDAGLRVISVADPPHPVEVGYYVTLGPAMGVAVTGDHAFVADYNLGLHMYQFYDGGIEESFRPRAASSKPLPTIIRGVLVLPVSPRPRVAESPCLLDVSGRKAMDLAPGANDVRALAPGVYFVLVAQAQAQAQAIRKVVVTK